MKKLLLFITTIFLLIGVYYVSTTRPNDNPPKVSPFEQILINRNNNNQAIEESESSGPQEVNNLNSVKIQDYESRILSGINHTFQTFNNCGPASLSMTLSFFDLNVSQKELGEELRPYQNSKGDNDDKSVTLVELKAKAEEYGFAAYHRPAGNIDLLQKFIANDMPVITRTWLKPDDDVGHYRVVKGYNKNEGYLIQDDSLQGKNLKFSYDQFNEIWKKFNYEYLVLVPQDKVEVAEAILGNYLNEDYAWQESVEISNKFLAEDANDVYARFNLAVAYYHLDMNQNTIEEFEQVQDKLSPRTLWYQIEPIKAYYEVGNYDKVLEITNNILSNNNRAFSELYILRGDIFMKRGEVDLARDAYEKAIFYNVNMDEAREKLNSL